MRSLDVSRIAHISRFGLALTLALHACACVSPRPGSPASGSWVQVLSMLSASR